MYEFRVPTVVQRIKKASELDPAESGENGEDSSDLTSISFGDFPEGMNFAEDDGSKSDNAGARAKNKKIRKAPDGAQASQAFKAMERVPEIKILTKPEEIEEKSLKGRAGRYYNNSQILFINGLYPVVERMAQDLERKLTGQGEPENVRNAAIRASQRAMAFRVGKSTC